MVSEKATKFIILLTIIHNIKSRHCFTCTRSTICCYIRQRKGNFTILICNPINSLRFILSHPPFSYKTEMTALHSSLSMKRNSSAISLQSHNFLPKQAVFSYRSIYLPVNPQRTEFLHVTHLLPTSNHWHPLQDF